MTLIFSDLNIKQNFSLDNPNNQSININFNFLFSLSTEVLNFINQNSAKKLFQIFHYSIQGNYQQQGMAGGGMMVNGQQQKTRGILNPMRYVAGKYV